MQDSSEHAEFRSNGKGAEIIALLKARKLPQMVDWVDPELLAKIGVRTVISGTMGQYADQRLMQAATDRAEEKDLIARYDYRKSGSGIWVDYISDLGDGFEATYAMAYLVAQDSLSIVPPRGVDALPTLPAGEILVMGGDQAYPQSSAQEYKERLQTPTIGRSRPKTKRQSANFLQFPAITTGTTVLAASTRCFVRCAISSPKVKATK